MLVEQVDTACPIGRTMLTIVAALSESVFSLIGERAGVGMKVAVMRGNRLGRHPSLPDL